jgi:glycosyltransferase involved in cell wall biosynthesis
MLAGEERLTKPRLLFVCSELLVGGAQRQWSLLIPRLRARFDVSLLTLLGEGPFLGHFQEAGVAVDCAQMRRRTDLHGWRRALRHADEEPDLIVTQSINADIVGNVIAARAHAAHVSTAHFNVGPGAPRSRYRELLARLLAPRVDGVIAVSVAQLPRLQRLGYPSAAIRIVANGVEVPVVGRPPQEMREALGIDPSEFLALLVATLRPEKRADLFVAAVRHAHAVDRRVRGVVVGGGSELERIRDAAGADGVVQVVGSRTDVPDIMAAADAVCLTSDAEGVPMVLLEAMALGRPAVATRVGGVSEAVDDEETGLLVPANDDRAFAAALLRLVSDPELRLRLGENARQRHRERFGVDRMVEEYAQIFDAVLEAKRSASA